MAAWAGGASSDAAPDSASAIVVTINDFTVVSSDLTRRATIKPPGRAFLLALGDDSGFFAFRDRPREFLLVADPLQFVESFVESGSEPLARCERRRQVLHALDDPDRLVMHRTFGVAHVVGHSVEHGGEHRLEDRAGDVRADAAMYTDAEAEVPVPLSIKNDLVGLVENRCIAIGHRPGDP